MHRLGHIPVVRITEAAWGDDSDEDAASVLTGPCKPEIKPSRQTGAACARRPQRAAQALAPPPEPPRGVPSLHTICLGVLALYVEELMGACAELAPWLHAGERAALLAVARRRGLVDDGVLLALADEEWRSLDLSACPPVTHAALLHVLPRLHALQALDISGCDVGPTTLANLASWCPGLETLCVGSQCGGVAGVGEALRGLVPTVAARGVSDVGDCWEDVAEGGLPGDEGGRLQNLRRLHWLGASEKAVQRLRGVSPRLLVTPAGPHPPLDDCHVAPLMQFEWVHDLEGGSDAAHAAPHADSDADVLPLAERFRMAYVSRSARIAVATERNRRRAARRALLRSSPAEMAIRLAECGVPLARVKR